MRTLCTIVAVTGFGTASALAQYGPAYGPASGPAYGQASGPVYGQVHGPVGGVTHGPVIVGDQGYPTQQFVDPHAVQHQPAMIQGHAGFQGGVVGAGGDIPWGENYGSGPQGLGYPGVNSNGGGDEQLYPYDQQDPWLHGYYQEIPAYGGYSHFRPYNFRHVLAQTQAAAGWGLSRTMPYSHQYWQHYHQRASLESCPLPYHAYDQYHDPDANEQQRDRLQQYLNPDQPAGR